MTIDTLISQLLTHLRRGGAYSYFWAASQAADISADVRSDVPPSRNKVNIIKAWFKRT